MAQVQGYFYATQRGLWAGRYYKIYVNENGLHGAWLARYNPEAELASAQAWGDEGKAWEVKRTAKKAQAKEEAYDRLHPNSEEFLRGDKRNFSFRPTQWKNLRIDTAPKGKSVDCYGQLVIELNNGKNEIFELVGKGSLDNTATMLGAWLAVKPAFQSSASLPVSKENVEESQQIFKIESLITLAAWGLTLVLCLYTCWQMRSLWGLAGLIIAPKIHAWMHLIFMGFYGRRITAAQLQLNRSEEQNQGR